MIKKEWEVDKTFYGIWIEQEDKTMKFDKIFSISNNEYISSQTKFIVNPCDELQSMQDYVNSFKQNGNQVITLLIYFFGKKYRNCQNCLNFEIPVGNEKMFERAKKTYPSYKNLIRL